MPSGRTIQSLTRSSFYLALPVQSHHHSIPPSQVQREAEPLQLFVFPIVLWIAIFYLLYHLTNILQFPKNYVLFYCFIFICIFSISSAMFGTCNAWKILGKIVKTSPDNWGTCPSIYSCVRVLQRQPPVHNTSWMSLYVNKWMMH